MKYTVVISKSIQKQIDKLPNTVFNRVAQKIRELADNPRPVGSIKLKGYISQYRVRVGDYRIRYEIDDDKILVKLLQCKHRRDVYKDKD